MKKWFVIFRFCESLWLKLQRPKKPLPRPFLIFLCYNFLELGYDLSEKIGKVDEEITALNSKLGTDVNDLEGKITALETKLNALSAIFNVRHWVIYIVVTLLWPFDLVTLRKQ